MPFVDALTGEAWPFALVFFRMAGLVSAMPLFGARAVPARLKIALAGTIAFSAFSGAHLAARPFPSGLLALASGAALETFVGLAGGLAAKVVLDAAQGAGQLAGIGAGLGYGAMLNPWSGESSSAPGEIVSNLALGLAVAAGLHREAVRWFVRSLQATPPGSTQDVAALCQGVANQAILSAGLAVRLAFPVLAAVLVAQMVLGLIGRSATSLNLSSITFAVTLLAGGGALYLIAPVAADAAVRASLAVFSNG